MNLAANARDAMPQGGHLQIETSDVRLDDDYIHGKPAVIPKGHYALITVSDDGHGIPAEDLPHIFEPFYTTKPSGKGTGLRTGDGLWHCEAEQRFHMGLRRSWIRYRLHIYTVRE